MFFVYIKARIYGKLTCACAKNSHGHPMRVCGVFLTPSTQLLRRFEASTATECNQVLFGPLVVSVSSLMVKAEMSLWNVRNWFHTDMANGPKRFSLLRLYSKYFRLGYHIHLTIQMIANSTKQSPSSEANNRSPWRWKQQGHPKQWCILPQHYRASQPRRPRLESLSW